MNEIEIRIGTQDDTGPGTRQAESRLKGLQKVGKAAMAGLGAAGAGAAALFAKGLADNMHIEVANDKLAGQLALSTEDAKKAGEIAGEVYGDNWGDSIDTVNDALKSVDNNIADLGTTSKQEVTAMTEDALALAQTFDMDVASSTEAVGALMKNHLAPNAKAAFDIITAGAQNGVNKADDLLETFTEYSPQFSKLGISGKDALNLLSAGLKAGARDTDTIADGFKELSIRAIDGTTLTAGGFKAIGENAKTMGEEFGKGGEHARAATQKVLEGLLKIKDPIEQNTAGTALFGTQWEDTIKKILPALANADEEIQNVDGSTEKMAATIGDNAQGKIDTLKRGFEQWTQKMASSKGEMGLLVSGVGEFGGGAVQLAGSLGMAAFAMKGLSAAMLMNPIGLTVVAIAALAAGLVVLWQKSETAREVMSMTFSLIAGTVLLNAKIVVGAAHMMATGIMNAVGGILDAVAKIPGPTQGAAKKAAKGFHDFEKGVESTFNKVEGKLDDYSKTVANLPKKIRLQADERDLQAKLRHSQESLKKLPMSKRTKIYGEITSAMRAIARVQAGLRGIRDRYVNVFVSEVQRDNAGGGHHVGRTSGRATGGAAGGLVMVGEAGRELVRLPFGSQVKPHGATEALMNGGGGGGSELRIRWVGGNAGDEFMRWLRKNIRIEGGDVQKVLGQA